MGAVTSIIHTKSNANANPSREVRTHYGLVVGRRMIDEGDFKVDAFLGIPYAKPPIGELRFQKPQPPDPWDGVLQATKFGPRAPQTDFLWERWTYRVGKSESCLTLNVFSPAWEPRNDQPNGFAVLVFVHGGGFIIDSAAKYGDEGICRYLCRHDVVVVTIQYRLGLLGFFSTGDEVCRGNMGLWDQTLALKWVKENISAFNGDPSRVTIFGQSAGGVCVDLLSLSPHSRDLFQQVIPMAGNAECEWGLTTNENLSVVCREFAQKLGWKSENKGVQASTEMLQFLRKKSAKLFERGIFGKGGIDVRKVKLDLAPVPDGDFLPKPIHVLRREAPKKRCMVGTCSYEGLLFAAIGSCNFGMKGIDQILDTIVPEENFPNWKEVRENAKELYINKAYEKHKMAKAFLRVRLKLNCSA
ncbi:hypothetical protein AB6A40_004027 [Gnathostoma spinigerum]|uniref:Carboxylesterase type B domain-containing protein n=1 Tax=Gnathostoma spinigerum TaxID=75299 RepID=A0ABD6EB98_9BILA